MNTIPVQDIVEKFAEANEALESIRKSERILAKFGYYVTITQQSQTTIPQKDIISGPEYKSKEERFRTKEVLDIIKACSSGEVSYREIAKKLGITEGAAKVWLTRKAKAGFPFTFGRNQSHFRLR